MLTKRIIPCLDVDHGRVVKGKRFKGLQDVAAPEVLAKFYSESSADELVFYDITASAESRDIFVDVVEKVAKNVNIPFTIGGGIKSVDDFRRILLAGADKISVNSAAVLRPELISEAAEIFGNQCVMLSIDGKRVGEDKWKVYINGGRTETDWDVIDWAVKAVKLGAGEICMNSIDTDGVKDGFDLALINKLVKNVNVPVIASGGAGKPEHFLDVLRAGADAALAASVFHYREIEIDSLKDYLAQNGINVRRTR